DQHFYHHYNYWYVDDMYNKLSTQQKLYYKLYFNPFKAFKFSIDYWAMGRKKYIMSWFRTGWEYSSKQWIYGTNLKWDVPDELYKGNDNVRKFYFIDGTYT